MSNRSEFDGDRTRDLWKKPSRDWWLVALVLIAIAAVCITCYGIGYSHGSEHATEFVNDTWTSLQTGAAND